jgi:hypothetical protein
MIANSPSDAPYQPWWAHWGIVFGANDSFTDLYAFRINLQKNFSLSRFNPYHWPGDRIVGYYTQPNWIGEIPEINNGPHWNTLRAEVRGSKVTYIVNGRVLGTKQIVGLDDIVARIGVMGGPVEVSPVDLRIDYFLYVPHY